MANHTSDTLSYAINGKTVRLSFIKTAASNIKVLSFSRKYGTKTLKTVSASGEYGINASWFANGGDNHIMNIAFQNGVRQGYFLSESQVPKSGGKKLDGYTNTTGSSVIYCKSGKAYYAANVTDSTESRIQNCTWVQGGLGLFLGHSDWKEMFTSEGNGSLYINSGATLRSALAIKTDTNMAYLMASPDNVTVDEFRTAIMRTFGLTDGAGNPNNPYARAIMLDGGGSTQLLGSSVSISSSRKIPQMLALVNKN